MRVVWGLVAVGMLVAAGPAGAQTPDTCSKFAAAVATNARNLAFVHAKSFVDKSAVQGTQRGAEEANILALLRLNIDLMAAHKCPLPDVPITRGGYLEGSAKCMASDGDTKTIMAACSGWMFDPAAPEPSADGAK